MTKNILLLEIMYKDSPNANPMEMIKDTMIALFGLYKSSWVEFKWYIEAFKNSPIVAIEITDIKIDK